MSARTNLRFALAAALLATVGCFAPEAHADGNGGWPPPPVTGGATDTPTPGGGDGPSTPGTPTPAPEGSVWVNGSSPLSETEHNFYHSYAGEGSQTISGYCAPVKVANGVWWYASGASWTYLINEETGAYQGSLSWWCWMPPKPTSSVVRCIVGMDGKGLNVAGPKATRTLDTARVRTAWSGNTTSVANCEDSAADLTIKAPMDALGSYQVLVDGISRTCTRWDFPGTNRAAIIKGCGPKQFTTAEARGSVYCDGRLRWAVGMNSWKSPEFYNPDMCLSTTGTGPRCVPAGAPEVRFDGRATRGRTIESFRNNADHTVEFGPFRTNGIRNVRNVFSKINVAGSPITEGMDPTDPNQSFTLPNVDEWVRGVAGSHTVSWVNPGVPGKPFTMDRTVSFTGDLTITSRSITGLNFITGDAEYATTTRTITVDNMTCDSATVAVDLYRAKLSATQ